MPSHPPSALAASALNRLLTGEPWACARLAPHAGKSVRLALGSRHITLAIQSGGLVQSSDPAIVPDVSVSVPAAQLRHLPGALRQRDAAALTALLHIQGDAGLAQVVAELARDLRWDVEQALAERFGDIAALRLMRVAGMLQRGARQAGQHLNENLSEYLAHESGLMASRPAVAHWQAALPSLAQRLDRLEARLQALAERRAGHA